MYNIYVFETSKLRHRKWLFKKIYTAETGKGTFLKAPEYHGHGGGLPHLKKYLNSSSFQKRPAAFFKFKKKITFLSCRGPAECPAKNASFILTCSFLSVNSKFSFSCTYHHQDSTLDERFHPWPASSTYDI